MSGTAERSLGPVVFVAGMTKRLAWQSIDLNGKLRHLIFDIQLVRDYEKTVLCLYIGPFMVGVGAK